MKILVVTHFFESHGGGIEIVAGQLAREFSRRGHRVQWFASNTDAPPKIEGVQTHAARAWNGVERACGVPFPLWNVRDSAALWRAVRRADIVHIHDFFYFGNVCAALFCRLTKTPFVVTQHIGVVPFKNQFLNRLQRKIHCIVGLKVLRRAQETVFVSHETRRYFSGLNAADLGQVIANGLDTTVFRAPENDEKRRDIRHSLGVSPDEPLVLFVGRFVEKKGVPLVLEMARLTPYRWILAGHGPLIDEKTALPPNIEVRSGLRGAAIADLMRACDVFVLPSVGEGFPLVVQEALACGAAVLAEESLKTALPEVAPFLTTQKREEVQRDGSQERQRWVEQLERLASERSARRNSPEYRAQIEFANREWSWEKCARRYEEIFTSVVVSSAGSQKMQGEI